MRPSAGPHRCRNHGRQHRLHRLHQPPGWRHRNRWQRRWLERWLNRTTGRWHANTSTARERPGTGHTYAARLRNCGLAQLGTHQALTREQEKCNAPSVPWNFSANGDVDRPRVADLRLFLVTEIGASTSDSWCNWSTIPRHGQTQSEKIPYRDQA